MINNQKSLVDEEVIISIHVSMSPVSARVLFVARFNRFCQVVALTTHWLEIAPWQFRFRRWNAWGLHRFQ